MAKTAKIEKRGGKRKNAGRKKLDDPTQPITTYIKRSRVRAWGGKHKIKKEFVKLSLSEPAAGNIIDGSKDANLIKKAPSA